MPIWYKTTFSIDNASIPIIRLSIGGMSKGQIYLNRHNIGRYWAIGPQKEYYLPEPWLKGKNEFVIFDEEGKNPGDVRLIYDNQELLLGNISILDSVKNDMKE